MVVSFPPGASAPVSFPASAAFSISSLAAPSAARGPSALRAASARAAKRGRHPRSRSALVTTHTELRLMAAAAIMGFRFTPQIESAPAATGMHTAL